MKCWFRVGFSIDDLTEQEAAKLRSIIDGHDYRAVRRWFQENISSGRLYPNGDTYAPDNSDDNEIAFPDGFEIYM